MGEQLGQRALDGGLRGVPRGEIAPGDAVQGDRGGEELAGEAVGEDLAAGGHRLLGEVGRPAGGLDPDAGQFGLALRAVQHGGDFVHEIIAGRTVGLPFGGQAFMGGEDFLDPDHRVALRQRVRAGFPRALQAAAQLAAIAARVGQAVHVVQAHAIDQALGVEAQDGVVAGLEDAGEFGAEAGQRVDVEEAAPVDFVGGRAPPGEAEILLVEQAVQALVPRFGLLVIGRRASSTAWASSGRRSVSRAAAAAARMPSRSAGMSAKARAGCSSAPPSPSRMAV